MKALLVSDPQAGEYLIGVLREEIPEVEISHSTVTQFLSILPLPEFGVVVWDLNLLFQGVKDPSIIGEFFRKGNPGLTVIFLANWGEVPQQKSSPNLVFVEHGDIWNLVRAFRLATHEGPALRRIFEHENESHQAG